MAIKKKPLFRGCGTALITPMLSNETGVTAYVPPESRIPAFPLSAEQAVTTPSVPWKYPVWLRKRDETEFSS